MKWKKLGAIAIIIILTGIVLFSLFGNQKMETPPAYLFGWKLKIIQDDENVIVLEIENISGRAFRNGDMVTMKNLTIPLYSLIEPHTDFPFNGSGIVYEDRDNNAALSIGDRLIIRKVCYNYTDYLNFSLSIITGYPWKECKSGPFTFGVSHAVAKIPPPYVRVTPEILNELKDRKDIIEGKNGDYYVWPIVSWHYHAS